MILLIAMAIVLAAELMYLLAKKKRRKEEMSLFRKNNEPAGEPLADKAHNTILTTESISQNLARQGADTSEADGLIAEAKREMARKNHARAIERAEAAKISLLRAKREMEADAANDRPPEVIADADLPESVEKARPNQGEKKTDSLPTNYMQAKFMLNAAKDLLEKRGITGGEAHELYTKGVACFEKEDYSKALSLAIKAERLLDSETFTLIGQDKPPAQNQEVVEVMVCPSCDKEVTEEDAFCRECGQNLAATPECPGCGAEISQVDKFCRKCGTKLR